MIDRQLLNTIFPSNSTARRWAKIFQKTPEAYTPTVTQNDIGRGFLIRYFARLSNDKATVIEVSKKEFTELSKYSRFNTVSINWKIIGKKETVTLPSGAIDYGVADYNLQRVVNADLTFGGLRGYIIDYTEFWVSET